MSYEQIQHLYEFVDTDKVRYRVFERICRLEDALNEQLYWGEQSRDSNEYKERSHDEQIELLGTVGKILRLRENRVKEFKWMLHVVRSILFSLALPTGDEASPEFHLDHALEVIQDLLEENSLRRKNWMAEYAEETTKRGTSIQQARRGAVSQTPSQTGSGDAPEKQNITPRDDHLPIPEYPQSPYLKFMNKLDAELGAKTAKMKKDEVKHHIEQCWDTDTLGERSAHKVEMMATMLRPPEAQKGRAKPRP